MEQYAEIIGKYSYNNSLSIFHILLLMVKINAVQKSRGNVSNRRKQKNK